MKLWRYDPSNELHVFINQRQEERADEGKPFEHSFYDFKAMIGEFMRLPYWLKLAFTGKLPKVHKQCSVSSEEEIEDNRLICALGKDVTSCPILKSYLKNPAGGNRRYVDMATICCWHIYTNDIGFKDGQERQTPRIDTSEGYVQDGSDRMFWRQVYQSMTEGLED